MLSSQVGEQMFRDRPGRWLREIPIRHYHAVKAIPAGETAPMLPTLLLALNEQAATAGTGHRRLQRAAAQSTSTSVTLTSVMRTSSHYIIVVKC